MIDPPAPVTPKYRPERYKQTLSSSVGILVQLMYSPQHDGGNERPCKGKDEDHTKIPKEIGLTKLEARIEDDGR